jgi:hypothetical protein
MKVLVSAICCLSLFQSPRGDSLAAPRAGE